MESKLKKRASIIIILGIFFAISSIYYSNPCLKATSKEKSTVYSNYFTFDRKDLKTSATSGKIHIDNNWTAVKAAGICTGNGTYTEPYVIKDLEIDGGSSGNCIWIENSKVYFRIENCTIYDSGDAKAGIRLDNSTNGKLINNNCSYNEIGIMVDSNNITISGNTANNNGYGIFLGYSMHCNDNNVSGNTANTNSWFGIHLNYCNCTTVSGNIMNDCGLFAYGSLEDLQSHDIDTTNLVNGKPLYYYTNEVNLGANDFTNAGQVILVNCNDSIVSNLDVSHGSIGIYLDFCYNNIFSGNTVNCNNWNGIILWGSGNNTVSGNSFNYNNWNGIILWDSDINNILDNTVNYNNYGGIDLMGCNNNTVSGNTINCNNDDGIWLHNSDYNTLSGNTVFNNSNIGVYMLSGSHDNDINLNCFINNSINAYDDGSNNHWDNGIKGNYWSDYTGSDADGDGIGDVPYNINGFTGSQDNFPLMKWPIPTQDGGGIPFELIILISVFSGGVLLGVATLLSIILKRKRIE